MSPPWTRWTTLGAAIIALLLVAGVAGASAGLRPIPSDLPERFQRWLEAIDTLISDREWAAFVALEENYQRDAFIEAFWRQRDPYPDTARNELRERIDERTAFARQRFDDLRADTRARFLMLNGIPDRWAALECPGITHQMEVWIYDLSLRFRDPFPVFFFRRFDLGAWVRWDEIYGTNVLFKRAGDLSLEAACEGLHLVRDALQMIGEINQKGGANDRYMFVLDRLEQPEKPPSGEWLGTFASYATKPPADAQPFDGEVSVSFPGWRQSRTVVQGVIRVAASALPPPMPMATRSTTWHSMARCWLATSFSTSFATASICPRPTSMVATCRWSSNATCGWDATGLSSCSRIWTASTPCARRSTSRSRMSTAPGRSPPPIRPSPRSSATPTA